MTSRTPQKTLMERLISMNSGSLCLWRELPVDWFCVSIWIIHCSSLSMHSSKVNIKWLNFVLIKEVVKTHSKSSRTIIVGPLSSVLKHEHPQQCSIQSGKRFLWQAVSSMQMYYTRKWQRIGSPTNWWSKRYFSTQYFEAAICHSYMLWWYVSRQQYI